MGKRKFSEWCNFIMGALHVGDLKIEAMIPETCGECKADAKNASLGVLLLYGSLTRIIQHTYVCICISTLPYVCKYILGQVPQSNADRYNKCWAPRALPNPYLHGPYPWLGILQPFEEIPYGV